jgi:transposase
MIALSPSARVYLACGVTDMRKGGVGLAMLVQQSLSEDPFDGSVYAFRGRRSGLIKLIWHDGLGLCMLTKRLEQGQFHWPSATTTGRISLSPAQLVALLDGCEWRGAGAPPPTLTGGVENGLISPETLAPTRRRRSSFCCADRS